MKKRVKNVLVLLLAALLAATAVLPAAAAFPDLKKTCDSAASPAGAAIVYNLTDDVIQYKKNSTKQIKVASITKVLNACTAAQFLKAKDPITVGNELSLMYWNSSTAPVRYGERYTFEQLLHAMLLPSGCDATYTVAVNVARKVKNDPALPIPEAITVFCGLMNDYAKELGCVNSHFVNPDGQDDERQHTCVKDVLLFTKKAYENEMFRQVVRMPKAEVQLVSGDVYIWENTNKLLREDTEFYYPKAVGLKTGYTINAGYGIVAVAEEEDRCVLAVVCGCSEAAQRFTTAQTLLQLGLFAARRGAA